MFGVVAVVVLAAVGAGGWLVLSRLSDDGGSDSAAPPSWGVGACVRQSGGPTSIPPSLTPDKRQFYESQRQYEPVDCDDPRALSKVTAMGVEVAAGKPRPTDDGCPDDTDAAYLISGILPSAGQVVCARFLKAPHPGDAGGGGGKVIVGDCVFVSSSDGVRPRSDQVNEVPCAEPGWFAQILATAANAAGCPADQTLSRLALPGRTDVTLCLGQGDRGLIAKPGQCVRLANNAYLPPARVDCGSSTGLPRLEGFVDSGGKCPSGQRAVPATGYDQPPLRPLQLVARTSRASVALGHDGVLRVLRRRHAALEDAEPGRQRRRQQRRAGQRRHHPAAPAEQRAGDAGGGQRPRRRAAAGPPGRRGTAR